MRAWILVLLAACGEAADDTAPVAAAGSFPDDPSAAGIAAFVADGAWREAPWVALSDTPRDQSTTASPHDRAQVWINDVLQDADGLPAGAMAVKEMVDAADAPVGHAVLLKTGEGDADWAYWCDASPQRCGTADTESPFYGTDALHECAICHAGRVFGTLE